MRQVSKIKTEQSRRYKISNGIGVTIPGLAAPETGTWIYAPFSGIRDFPIGRILSEHYGNVPISVDNDVNACAMAEKLYGRCRETDDYLWVTVSNGIGGGLVLNGNLYPGHFGNAAEIGHFSVVEKSPFPCGCGNYGCLEAEAAGPRIERRYRRLYEQLHTNPQLVPSPSAKEIAKLARSGDGIAINVVETTDRLLGKAAAYVANLLNLEMIVFGGGVMESFDLFYPSMQESFQSGLFRSANTEIRLEKTALGYNAALVGAAALAAELSLV